MAGVRDAGYATATPIQAQAIPVLLEGHDVIGLAQTGTGKTAAFVLPLLQRMIASGARKEGPIRTLVLAPTRELAVQIQQDWTALGRHTGYRSAAVIGGVSQFGQVKALRRASVCVACPGRLLDLMDQRLADLSNVDALVLDEADTMLDMGFLPAIKAILAKLPTNRQTLLFSATMPAQIRTLAEGMMTKPQMIKVSNTAPAASVSHTVYPVEDGLKLAVLETMLKQEDAESVIVFTRTKHRAKSLALKLGGKGLTVTSLQGNMSQNKRQEAMSGFKSGKYRVLVATDIAARGIDCKSVSHVINFDPPDTAEAYTHRIGRTGRAERSGMAVTLMTSSDRRLMRDIERALGCCIERGVFPQCDCLVANAPRQDQGRLQTEDRRPEPRRAAADRSGDARRAGPRPGQPQRTSRTGQDSRQPRRNDSAYA
ncbi:DEAD/DEAH box helicase [Megalodesulfovibrio gigas]|nr:DEAD/DEAH box helicase [Megalodesulfovibrio gigas]